MNALKIQVSNKEDKKSDDTLSLSSAGPKTKQQKTLKMTHQPYSALSTSTMEASPTVLFDIERKENKFLKIQKINLKEFDSDDEESLEDGYVYDRTAGYD